MCLYLVIIILCSYILYNYFGMHARCDNSNLFSFLLLIWLYLLVCPSSAKAIFFSDNSTAPGVIWSYNTKNTTGMGTQLTKPVVYNELHVI